MARHTAVRFSPDQLAAAAAGWTETLRADSLSLGFYVLPAGTADPQQPHREDEVYFVVEGRGSLEIAGEREAVTAGSVAYVAAGVPHRFVEIEETLRVVVLFAPPESDASAAPGGRA